MDNMKNEITLNLQDSFFCYCPMFCKCFYKCLFCLQTGEATPQSTGWLEVDVDGELVHSKKVFIQNQIFTQFIL